MALHNLQISTRPMDLLSSAILGVALNIDIEKIKSSKLMSPTSSSQNRLSNHL
jgi:hypothetical protein